MGTTAMGDDVAAWAEQCQEWGRAWRTVADLQRSLTPEELAGAGLAASFEADWDQVQQMARHVHPDLVAKTVDALAGIGRLLEERLGEQALSDRVAALEAVFEEHCTACDARLGRLAGTVKDGFRAVRSVARALADEACHDLESVEPLAEGAGVTLIGRGRPPG